jgi:hypothetical protein
MSRAMTMAPPLSFHRYGGKRNAARIFGFEMAASYGANRTMRPSRVAAVKNERDAAQVAFDRALAETRPEARITQEKIAKFVEVMRTNVLTGETPFRRAYIRAVVDQVEVDDNEIRIVEQAMAWGSRRAGEVVGDGACRAVVRYLW